jgi:hypothetical protein
MGVAEDFLTPELAGVRTVAPLTRPLGATRTDAGFVVCHGFGQEQLHLSRLDTMLARSLAREGFSAIRFHAPGYGDSFAGMREVTLASHLEAIEAAVALLGSETGARTIGVAGARFGATLAALAAERLGLPMMALWEPQVSGETFMRDFLRAGAFTEMIRGVAGATPPGRPAAGSDIERYREALALEGWADVKGFALTREAYEEISGVDLIRDVRAFRGAALVGAVTKAAEGGLRGRAAKLADHLRSLGVDCTVEVIRDAQAPQLGQYHYTNSEDGNGNAKEDVQLAMFTGIATATVSWARSVAAERRTFSGAGA